MAIRNFRKLSKTIATAGQPTEDELRSLAEEGFEEVVNLATYKPGASLENEEGIVTSLGMRYHPIPVEWDRPTGNDFERFVACLKSLEGRKVLVHCAANYRVSAFVSLYAMSELGWSEDDADRFISSVWNPSEYPVWDRFIAAIKKRIGA